MANQLENSKWKVRLYSSDIKDKEPKYMTFSIIS